jgi:diadenosine tetraphosphatase ApaH/serine/threonine PP2A family protein phosphatase
MALPLWSIPAALTAAIWAAVYVWPVESRGGGYNFGQAIESAVHVVFGVVSTLVVWLVFFIAV